VHYGRFVWRVTTKDGFTKDYKLLTWAEKFARTLRSADITLTHISENGYERSRRKIWLDGKSLFTDWERHRIS
jgi:hypothetical protein